MTESGTPYKPPEPKALSHAVDYQRLRAVQRLAGWRPYKIIGEPTAEDVQALINDLDTIAEIIDPLIESVGEYASGFLPLSIRDRHDFRNVIYNALQGNATFGLENSYRYYVAHFRGQDDAC